VTSRGLGDEGDLVASDVLHVLLAERGEVGAVKDNTSISDESVASEELHDGKAGRALAAT